MTNLVLNLLLTALPITGNQIVDLDFRVQVLGESVPPDLCAQRLKRPFLTPTQRKNFAILCATLDWDATLLFTERTPAKLHDLQVFSANFLSLPEGSNSTNFLLFHANTWQTNWIAGPVEEALLKRLKVLAPAEADAFFVRLVANPQNIQWTRWYSWHNLILERRKAEANAMAAREELNTTNAFSVQFPCPAFEMPKLQILWPRVTRTDLYQYYFPGKRWTFSIIPSPARPVFVPADWTPPEGNHNRRSWQPGPAWQVTYNQHGNTLTRTATYVKTDSYVAGTIQAGGFAEEIVEIRTPPKCYLQMSPSYVEVQ